METVKVKLTIAYEGTQYQGWQVQKVGLGVQQKVEEALGHLFPSVKRIYSSSRTDTGVHALGMVVDFNIPRPELKMSLGKLPLAINAWLPDDIRVLAAQRVAHDFHARFDAAGKQYRYYTWNHAVMNPLQRHQAWHVPVKLDVPAMRRAARILVGRHDFRSFAALHHYPVADTVRTLTRCDLKKSGALLTFVIEGEGFLYKMCRGIVGTLVQLGRGRFNEEDLQRMLAAKDRRQAGMSAPAHGLVLWKVFYRKKSAIPRQPSTAKRQPTTSSNAGGLKR